jgi:hypothetical protein
MPEVLFDGLEHGEAQERPRQGKQSCYCLSRSFVEQRQGRHAQANKGDEGNEPQDRKRIYTWPELGVAPEDRVQKDLVAIAPPEVARRRAPRAICVQRAL